MSKVAEDTKFLFQRKYQDFKIYFTSEAEKNQITLSDIFKTISF